MTEPVIIDTTFVSQCHPSLLSRQEKKKTLFPNPFKWRWTRDRGKIKLPPSSYRSAGWTETERLIRRWNDLITSSATAGGKKVQIETAVGQAHLSPIISSRMCGCIILKHPSGHGINSLECWLMNKTNKRVRLRSLLSAFLELVYLRLCTRSLSWTSKRRRGEEGEGKEGWSPLEGDTRDWHVATVARMSPQESAFLGGKRWSAKISPLTSWQVDRQMV